GWATPSTGAGRPSWGRPRGGSSKPRSARSFDRQRVDRRANGARERQRRRDEEELEDAVPCAVFGQLVEREDLADQHAQVGDEVRGPRVVVVGTLVGPPLHAPRVGGEGGERTLVEPAGRREREPRRVPASVVAPATLLLAHRHLSGPDEQGIAGTDLHVVR